MLGEITPLLITWNEAANIVRTVDKLRWAARIVVVDSGSTDGTLALLARFPQVEVIHHRFESFAEQCNFGLAQIRTAWVLSLDADYELSDELVAELGSLTPPATVAGYRVGFVYRIHGRPLPGSLYPPRTVLYRKDRAVYRNEGHGHRVGVDGEVLPLAGIIYHDDRKPLARWLDAQLRYARDEADHLLDPGYRPHGWPDRLRRMAWPMPIAALLYALFVKGGIFAGRAGWQYALQRAVAEALIALEIADRRLRHASVPAVAGVDPDPAHAGE